MRYAVHVYTDRDEFAQFLLGFRDVAYACEAAADHLSTRPGYRAEVHARERIGEPATLVAEVSDDGKITYVQKDKS